MVRPLKNIDWAIFEQLCHMQCTQNEIASFFHVDADTIRERTEREYGESYSVMYKKFSEGGKCSLRRFQWRMAEKSCAMAIWLGKQVLGQREHQDVSIVSPAQISLDKDHEIMILKNALRIMTDKHREINPNQ